MLEQRKTDAQEGFERSKKYMRRQLWKLKWVMLTLVGLASLYTINTGTYVIPFNGFSWFATLLIIMYYQIRMNKLFELHVMDERRSREPNPELMKSIQMYAWAIWIFSTFVVYWISIMIYTLIYPPAVG